MSSRIHRLRGFGPDTFVKRDDELSFGVSGSKLRKMRSLVPHLLAARYEEVAVIAGSRSNNLLALFQACFEAGMRVKPFLLESHSAQDGVWWPLFCDEKDVTWVPRSDWPRVEELASSYAEESSRRVFVLPEGSYHPYAFEGAMTLADEIMSPKAHDLGPFDRILVDAGTGLTAKALLLGLSRYPHPPAVTVLMLAEPASPFKAGLESFAKQFSLSTENIPAYDLIRPSLGRSFGSTPAAVFKEIQRVAREEGILVDPIYSGKLFLAARSWAKADSRDLIIHSGGGLSLGPYLNRFK